MLTRGGGAALGRARALAFCLCSFLSRSYCSRAPRQSGSNLSACKPRQPRVAGAGGPASCWRCMCGHRQRAQESRAPQTPLPTPARPGRHGRPWDPPSRTHRHAAQAHAQRACTTPQCRRVRGRVNPNPNARGSSGAAPRPGAAWPGPGRRGGGRRSRAAPARPRARARPSAARPSRPPRLAAAASLRLRVNSWERKPCHQLTTDRLWAERHRDCARPEKSPPGDGPSAGLRDFSPHKRACRYPLRWRKRHAAGRPAARARLRSRARPAAARPP